MSYASDRIFSEKSRVVRVGRRKRAIHEVDVFLEKLNVVLDAIDINVKVLVKQITRYEVGNRGKVTVRLRSIEEPSSKVLEDVVSTTIEVFGNTKRQVVTIEFSNNLDEHTIVEIIEQASHSTERSPRTWTFEDQRPIST